MHRSLEYDPRYYGLFFHDDTELPLDAQMWTHLDTHYQGELVHLALSIVVVSLCVVCYKQSCCVLVVDLLKSGNVCLFHS